MIPENSELSDLPQIGECHKRAFPKALSTRQGDRFISKMMEWYITSDRGVLFHLTEGNRIIGYCGGIITLHPGQHGAVSSIAQYAFGEFVRAYLRKPWLFFHKENIKKSSYIFRNILYKLGLAKAKKASTESIKNFESFMGLVVIGVDPDFQGKGLGSILLREFEKRARELGVHHIQLSVISSNLQAIKAYQKNGWVISFTGERSLQLKKIL